MDHWRVAYEWVTGGGRPRLARAELTGDAFTFVAPQEQGDLSAIEREVGKRLQRLTLEGFDYEKKPEERFEIPIAERIAAIRARKSEERARARQKAERKAQNAGGQPPARAAQPQGPRNDSRGRGPQGPRTGRAPQPATPQGGTNPWPNAGHSGHRGGAARPASHRSPTPPTRDPQAQSDERAATANPVERASKISSTFNPSRFNRFRR